MPNEKSFDNQIIDIDEHTMRELKTMNFTAFKNLAIQHVIKASLEDNEKYAKAVDTLKSLMTGELPDDFNETLQKKYDEMTERQRMRDFPGFKFELIIKEIKRRTPKEIEGKL